MPAGPDVGTWLRWSAAAAHPSAGGLFCRSGPSLQATLKLLSLTGLNDAFVMLRTPDELSEGQHYRLQRARWLVQVSTPEGLRNGS